MLSDSAGPYKNKKSALKKTLRKNCKLIITQFEGEVMDPIQKLLALMDWQDANRPLKVEEKAELMKLPDNEFGEQLHQMAVDFKNDGVIRT
jgi:hypothetical protein